VASDWRTPPGVQGGTASADTSANGGVIFGCEQTSGEGCSDERPNDSKRVGAFCFFATGFSTCDVGGGWNADLCIFQEIAAVLRHRSLLTTEIYAKVDVVTLRQIAQP